MIVEKKRRPVHENGHKLCTPLSLTHLECRMILLAVGARLERLVTLRAAGAITGKELDRRIEMWRKIVAKLEECLGESFYTGD